MSEPEHDLHKLLPKLMLLTKLFNAVGEVMKIVSVKNLVWRISLD